MTYHESTIPPRFEDEHPQAAQFLVDAYQEIAPLVGPLRRHEICRLHGHVFPIEIGLTHFGRNEKCDCGSGKKTKRCCLLIPPVDHNSYNDWSMRITRLGDEEVDIQIDSKNLVRRRRPQRGVLASILGATAMLAHR